MLERVARIGRQAALAAGAVIRQNYLKPHQVTLKGLIDPVTETDYQAQEIIVAIIRQAFPDHGFLAEERTGEGDRDLRAEAAGLQTPHAPTVPPPCHFPSQWGPAPGGRKQYLEEGEGGAVGAPCPTTATPYCWIIDPLDGTVNFAHGFPMFCVSIAFEAAGKLSYGIIYDPLRDELFEAQLGHGARLNGRPIRVSSTERLEGALVATGFPYDIRERLPETMVRMGRILGAVQGLRRAGSAALDMCYVACGRFDGFYEENLKPWDTAAGLLLISEAGGRLSTFTGGPYDIYSPDILASNEVLHPQLLNCLKA